jgi:hypothetical protein
LKPSFIDSAGADLSRYGWTPALDHVFADHRSTAEIHHQPPPRHLQVPGQPAVNGSDRPNPGHSPTGRLPTTPETDSRTIMTTPWITRPETDADHDQIREVNLAAFPTSHEADLVEALRADPAALRRRGQVHDGARLRPRPARAVRHHQLPGRFRSLIRATVPAGA